MDTTKSDLLGEYEKLWQKLWEKMSWSSLNIPHQYYQQYIGSKRVRKTGWSKVMVTCMCDERARMLQDQFHVSMNHVQAMSILISTFHHGKNPSAIDQGPEKSQVGRRKALSDLTNSVNQPPSKKIQDGKKHKKLIYVAEEENFPKDIAGERFLHNHQECVKARTNNLDVKRFLNLFGLDDEGKI
ncbi:hypothetical protein LguiB_002037 [Lonicera macranthoides]